jgi:hypothetical protein
MKGSSRVEGHSPGWTAYTLIGGAVVFTSVGVLSLFLEVSEGIAIALFFLAALLVVVAVFERRMEGMQEFGPKGAKLNLGQVQALRQAEQELRSGAAKPAEIIEALAAGEVEPQVGSRKVKPEDVDRESGPREPEKKQSSKRLEVLFSSQGQGDLLKLTPVERARLLAHIDALSSNGFPDSRTHALAGFPGWFVMKSGRYRALLQPIYDNRVLVASIADRADF